LPLTCKGNDPQEVTPGAQLDRFTDEHEYNPRSSVKSAAKNHLTLSQNLTHCAAAQFSSRSVNEMRCE
jgi:hypothetical protein